jgi:hypothetical protein
MPAWPAASQAAFDYLWRIILDADHGEIVDVELLAVIHLHFDVRSVPGSATRTNPDIHGQA